MLKNLASHGKHRYKRYSGLPLRYAGGKSLAVGHILENLPDHVTRLASSFFGGGSVEIAVAKGLGVEVAGYDVFDILVNINWQVQLNNPARLAELITKWQPEKAVCAEVKERPKKCTWQMCS